MEIKKGQKFECINSIFINKDEVLYIKGKTYPSERDGCITDEKGRNYLRWQGLETFKYHFKLVEEPLTLDTIKSVKVNNKAEFEALMRYYDSKGWKWVFGSSPTEASSSAEYYNYSLSLRYKDGFDCCKSRETDIDFKDFAKLVGIELPIEEKPKFEDGKEYLFKAVYRSPDTGIPSFYFGHRIIPFNLIEHALYEPPKPEYPKVMMVSDDGKDWYQRVVVKKVDDRNYPYITWECAETIEEAETEGYTNQWKYAKELDALPTKEENLNEDNSWFGNEYIETSYLNPEHMTKIVLPEIPSIDKSIQNLEVGHTIKATHTKHKLLVTALSKQTVTVLDHLYNEKDLSREMVEKHFRIANN